MSDDPDYILAQKLQRELNGEDSDSPQPSTSRDSTKNGDYALALQLQAEFDAENGEIANGSNLTSSFFEGNEGTDADKSDSSVVALDMSNRKLARVMHRRQDVEPVDRDAEYLNQTQNLVHPEWELIDPIPDIFAMFTRFDEKFFHQRLGAVRVEWSKRMFSCAGICYQRGNRITKEIIIRLSEPLLKLRPRKDLVETLLHEMIHAYCFVLNILEGNGGHGPNFKRIMQTINKVAGTNITVYHTFHDEVAAYKTHIWRCNGVCQNHHPFMGWVKRTSNRAPGPSDQWWEKHQHDCGGTFEKKSEPEKPVAKPAARSNAKTSSKATSTVTSNSNSGADIRKYFGQPKRPNLLPQAQPHLGVPANYPASSGPGKFPPTSYPGPSSEPFAGIETRASAKKRNNIRGIKDLNTTSSPSNSNKDKTDHSKDFGNQGQGRSLMTGGPSPGSSTLPTNVNRNHVRELWSKRFPTENKPTENQSNKRRRESEHSEGWEICDEDVLIRDVEVPTITISDSEHDDNEQQPPARRYADDVFPRPPKPAQAAQPRVPPLSSQELSIKIKREVMMDECGFTDDDIVMIDDEYDDNCDEVTAAIELADQSIADEIFGDDTLMQEFELENDVVACNTNVLNNADNDITSCPICFEKMRRFEFTNHLEGCRFTIPVKPKSFKNATKLPGSRNTIYKKPRVSQEPKTAVRRSSRRRDQLLSAGYTESDIGHLNLSTSSDSDNNNTSMTPRQLRQRSLNKQTTQCPKCGQELLGHQISAHRTICKRKKN